MTRRRDDTIRAIDECDTDAPWRDADILNKLYWGDGLSQSQVANALGCEQPTVADWMKRCGIESRDRSVDLDEDRLQSLYVKEGLNQYEIADRVGCTQTYVSELMRKYGMNTMRRRLEKSPAFRVTGEGYHVCETRVGGGKVKVNIHRLIAAAEFGVDSLDGKVVHHRNNIPWDNRPSNLDLMTPSEHSTHHEKNLVWDSGEEAFVEEVIANE